MVSQKIACCNIDTETIIFSNFCCWPKMSFHMAVLQRLVSYDKKANKYLCKFRF